jgi:predicted phage terminase large subunit-like protein
MGKARDKGDPSAIVFLGRTRDGTLWVEADVERRPVTKIIGDGIDLARRWQRETGGLLDGFGVESDLFQKLIADEFARQTKAAGIMLPVYEVYTKNVEKDVRIRRLTPYLSRGLFRWRNTPGTQALVRQAREFPVGEHDDALDALEQALRLAVDISHERAPR